MCSCKVTKFVPDGEYLLDDVSIRTDGDDIKKGELDRYVRQSPNSSVFGIWRMQLRLYSLAGYDASRWHNRVLMRAGEAPVIYDEGQTKLSEESLRQAMVNKGYVDARVSSSVTLDNKRARVVYHIRENEPYRLRDYYTDLPDSTLRAAATDAGRSLVTPGMLFDVDRLNDERERVSNELRQQGYYKFSKELLSFTADSALGTHRVDVTMQLSKLLTEQDDSLQRSVFSPYHLRHVVFFTSRALDLGGIMRGEGAPTDYSFSRQGDYFLISHKESFLKLKTLVEHTYVEPGELYTDASVQRTYSALGSLPPVRYVDIRFHDAPGDSLDCFIHLTPSKLFSLTAGLEATYTEGYWGVAADVGMIHRNVFKSAESLSLQGRLAYEWQGSGVLATELGMQAGLQFQDFLMPFVTEQFKKKVRGKTQFTAEVSSQNRPDEFNVKRFGVGMNYNWSSGRLLHIFDLIDVNYVDFDVEDVFRTEFLETNRFNPYSYESHFITRFGYTLSFTTFDADRPLRNHLSMRYGIETAGNVFYGINTLLESKKNSEGAYTIVGGIPYSQYVRTDINFTAHQVFDQNNRFVYHLFAGVGVPYGNASVIPYERRYFAGGANSVRGWSESTLGPGAYQRDASLGRGRDYNQMGDIKIDLNWEYRFKMFGKLDGALFADAGNIWTIKPYETQPGGEFRFDSFFKQLAVAYGAGLRADFSFLVLRFDVGIKLHDPSAAQGERWRLQLTGDDFALHLAIGYPF